MRTPNKEVVVFSIDGVQSQRRLFEFLRYCDKMKALGYSGPVPYCIGKWKGGHEVSFACLVDDYLKIVMDTNFLKHQESVMYVDSMGGAYLMDTKLEETHEVLGRLKTTTKEPTTEAWTYLPSLGLYWSIED